MLQYVDSVGNPGIPQGQCGMETGSMDRRPWLGPLLLVGGWLAEGLRVNKETSHTKVRGVRDQEGITVHFPCRLGVGVRASETCTPTQEEMGLRLFDLKPPSWCLVQFPKMVAHLLGRGNGKNDLVWRSSKGSGETVVLLNLTQKRMDWKEALGEWVTNTLEKALHRKLQGLLRAPGQEVPVLTGKQSGTINQDFMLLSFGITQSGIFFLFFLFSL